MNQKRKKHTQIYSGSELHSFLKGETQRITIPQRKNKHFSDLNIFHKWLKSININDDIFENKDVNEILSEAHRIQELVVTKTLQRGSKNNNLFKAIASYLGEEDKPQKCSFILVFGSQDNRRIKKGVELWKKGIAPMIIITGAQPTYKKTIHIPESVRFARVAEKLGVPKDRMIVEPLSYNLADNVKTTLNILDTAGADYRKGFATVIAWFAQRRLNGHLKKWLAINIPIYRINTDIISEQLKQNNWWKSEKGIKLIFNEFVKLKISELLGTG